ncbi:MAG: hypothetical protein DRJ05_13150 [Bacteroidetes bacterium]|nr:MAG: hypothetical protein DRJ05_13150 [Bacteroidota bacterium]
MPFYVFYGSFFKQINIFITLLLIVSGTQNLWSQSTSPAPFHTEIISIDFGTNNGKVVSNFMDEYSHFNFYFKTPAQTLAFPPSEYLAVKKTIKASDHAPWVRLRFAEVNLGKNSYLVITSIEDGDQQFFNTQTIDEWQGQTAFFRGEELDVELFIAPGDKEIKAKVKELIVGEFLGGQPIPYYLCGSDSRAASSYPYIDGRILPIGCTGWISAGGFYITAGHCLNVSSYDLQVIQFNVPNSLCDGTLVPSAVEDQYPIIYSSRVFQEADPGDDWGIFNCSANSNTGLRPTEAQRAYYHLSKNLNPASIQIRGFGTDHTPSGCTGYYNFRSQTLQYDIGDNLGEYFNGSSDVYWEYLVDTQGGNSGSAIMASGVSGVLRHAIGMHTDGGCNPPNTGNKGTSFEADDTEAAMNSYWQTNAEYVDKYHHTSSTVGSSVLPHYSLQNALDEADAGHGPSVTSLELILIAGSNNGNGAGEYNENIHFSGAVNGVYIRPTVGTIKIGPNIAKSASNPSDKDEELSDLKKEKLKSTDESHITVPENGLFPGQTESNIEEAENVFGEAGQNKIQANGKPLPGEIK